jgi:hypothetical protein
MAPAMTRGALGARYSARRFVALAMTAVRPAAFCGAVVWPEATSFRAVIATAPAPTRSTKYTRASAGSSGWPWGDGTEGPKACAYTSRCCSGDGVCAEGQENAERLRLPGREAGDMDERHRGRKTQAFSTA